MNQTKYLVLFLIISLSVTLFSCGNQMPDFFEPEIPWGEPFDGGADDGDAPSFDITIYDYDGRLADDSDKDVVGTDTDIYWEANKFSSKIIITWSDSRVSVENGNSDVKCYSKGGHVVVDMLTNSVSSCEIELKGSSENGSIKIYGEKKFKLTLNGINLKSNIGPAINSQCKKRIFVHLADGTVNTLVDAASYSSDIKYINEGTADSEDRKGCFFSEGNLIFSGTGALTVAAKMKHGIVTDGYMYTRPGVTIAVTEAVKNAIHVKGDTGDAIGIRITGGYIYTCTEGKRGKV